MNESLPIIYLALPVEKKKTSAEACELADSKASALKQSV